MRDINFKKFIFGRDVLGPIFYDFCRKLYLYQYGYQKNATTFFAYRGGARLLYIYEKYLRRRSLSPPVPQIGFFISRILALKGTIWNAYDQALQIVLREYPNTAVSEFISNLCTGKEIDIPERVSQKSLDAKIFREIVYGTSPWMKEVQEYLRGQENLLREYVYSLIEKHDTILFVDTGWSGTTQHFLMKGFPEFKWEGIYFGKWDTWRKNPPHFHTISGISVEGLQYTRKQPQTAIFQYHHIIEAPLEPNFRSIEHLQKDAAGRICASSKIDSHMIPPQGNEPIFMGICNFVDNPPTESIDEISRIVYKAWIKLQKKILFPTVRDSEILEMNPRSADFGKSRFVQVLYSPGNRKAFSLSSKLKAIKRSIWKQGKIAQEFPFVYPLLQCLYNFLALYLRVNANKVSRFMRLCKF